MSSPTGPARPPDGAGTTAPSTSSRPPYAVAIVAMLVCLAVGALGGLLTSTSVDTWFPTIEKPPWNPPGWVFGPVWTTLYVMMAIAYFAAWRGAGRCPRRGTALFAAQLALNLGWSAVFFGLRRPDLALVEIVILLAAIAWTAHEFRKHSSLAAMLLLPYLLWVSYATSLNAGIVWLNR